MNKSFMSCLEIYISVYGLEGAFETICEDIENFKIKNPGKEISMDDLIQEMQSEISNFGDYDEKVS